MNGKKSNEPCDTMIYIPEQIRIESKVSDWLELDTGIEEGKRVCVVGDVHGFYWQFESLMNAMETSSGEYDHNTLLLLGDLIDRGPYSIRCIDAAIDSQERNFDDFTFLMGNHEQMMCLALSPEPKHNRKAWEGNGAEKTLANLKLYFTTDLEDDEFIERVSEAFGKRRLRFLRELAFNRFIGNLLFVHAGIHPKKSLNDWLGIPWHKVTENHWLWIRYPFLSTPLPWEGLTVVHGHSPTYYFSHRKGDHDLDQHMYNDGKINLDAGCIHTNSVAGAEFVTGRYRVLFHHYSPPDHPI